MIASRLMPERKCVGCKKQDQWGCHAREYTDPETGQTKWYKPAAMSVKVDEQEHWGCPRQHMYENPQWWNDVLLYYGMFKRGMLPDEGGVSEQSNRAIAIFGILEDVNAECDKSIAEKEARKAKRAPPKGRK